MKKQGGLMERKGVKVERAIEENKNTTFFVIVRNV